jgi:type I restriction enzyme S subunit
LVRAAQDRIIEGARKVVMEVTKSGSLLFSFKLSIGQVAFAGVDMFTNEAIASFPPQRGFISRFLFYALPVYVVENAQTNIYGAKLLNQFLIKNAPIVRPPIDEQKSIIALIDHETAKLNSLISKYGRELELLAEYRSSLISRAVTGKIDVRRFITQPAQPKFA